MTDGFEAPLRGTPNASSGNPSDRPAAYELYNVFGTPTGRRVMLAEGENLPAVPKGWFWRPVGEN